MLRQPALLCLLLTGMTNAQHLGQLEGSATSAQIVEANTAITGFQKGLTFQGFTSENNQIKVTKGGFYYIYAQVFFGTYPDGPAYHNRVALTVNGDSFALLQTGLDNRGDYGSYYTGGVIRLEPGYTIGLMTVSKSRLWVSDKHTFFGAYQIYVAQEAIC